MTLKQLELQIALEEASVNGFLDVGIRAGKEAFLELIEMNEDLISKQIAFNQATLKQKLVITQGGAPVTLEEAFKHREFYEKIIDSSLALEIPDLYTIAKEDYLNLVQAIEEHLVTHDTKGKITRNAKRKKSTEDSATHSDQKD